MDKKEMFLNVLIIILNSGAMVFNIIAGIQNGKPVGFFLAGLSFIIVVYMVHMMHQARKERKGSGKKP